MTVAPRRIVRNSSSSYTSREIKMCTPYAETALHRNRFPYDMKPETGIPQQIFFCLYHTHLNQEIPLWFIHELLQNVRKTHGALSRRGKGGQSRSPTYSGVCRCSEFQKTCNDYGKKRQSSRRSLSTDGFKNTTDLKLPVVVLPYIMNLHDHVNGFFTA